MISTVFYHYAGPPGEREGQEAGSGKREAGSGKQEAGSEKRQITGSPINGKPEMAAWKVWEPDRPG